MNEIGILNRNLAAAISKQGHGDLLMITDAGFAIPKDMDVIDLSLAVNSPKVIDVICELKKYFSAEKFIISASTEEISPSHFNSLKSILQNINAEVVTQKRFIEISKNVKVVVRTGDFTAFGNVILVSGAGDRWYCEK
ncbi:MAG: D-ribose pyranase [Anaerovoracaceae bacterium]